MQIPRKNVEAFFKNTIIPFVVPPNFFGTNFSWGDCKSQEKLKTMLMQKFADNEEYYDIFEKGLLPCQLTWPPDHVVANQE